MGLIFSIYSADGDDGDINVDSTIDATPPSTVSDMDGKPIYDFIV